MSSDDDWWNLLLASLASIAEVTKRDPHGLVVTIQRDDGTTALVEIVMTPEEWDDLVSISWGVAESAAQHVKQLVLDQSSDERYLVYSDYELVACATPTVPMDPGMLQLQSWPRSTRTESFPAVAGSRTGRRTTRPSEDRARRSTMPLSALAST